MRIIGHRGAAGLALENSAASLTAAWVAGAEAIEIDVRLSQDHHLVVMHDKTTKRVSRQNLAIDQSSWSDLHKIKLLNGEPLLDLTTARQIVAGRQLFIEMKGAGWTGALAQNLPDQAPNTAILAFNKPELVRWRQQRPDIPTYVLTAFRPWQSCRFAKQHSLAGVDWHWWLLNPLSYRLAKRYGLDIIVYTVNSVWLAKTLLKLYPQISLTTNYPDRLKKPLT